MTPLKETHLYREIHQQPDVLRRLFAARVGRFSDLLRNGLTNPVLVDPERLLAAFLPPTLVAGLFGMNFEGLPWAGSSWGFHIALGLCLLSSAAVWLFLWSASRR